MVEVTQRRLHDNLPPITHFQLAVVEEPHAEIRVLKPSNFRYFHGGQGEKPSELDYVSC